MPMAINSQTYYRTAEVCQIAGIARSTLFRWLKQDILDGPVQRDRRRWRVFTKDQVDKIKAEAHRIN